MRRVSHVHFISNIFSKCFDFALFVLVAAFIQCNYSKWQLKAMEVMECLECKYII